MLWARVIRGTSSSEKEVTPRDAMASAGATLRSLVELVENMSEEAEGLTALETENCNEGVPCDGETDTY